MNSGIYNRSKFIFIGIIIVLFVPILFAMCSLEGDINILRKRPVENPSENPKEDPDEIDGFHAPDAPIVTASDGLLTVSWTEVKGATAYEVWFGTENNSETATKNGDDESTSLFRMINGLDNGTTYYIWLKAKNNISTSGFSPMASGKPLGTPEAPTVSSAYKQLLVTWEIVPGADEYEVYYGGNTWPEPHIITTSETTATITSLVNGQIYYVYLRAKNTTGISDYGAKTNNAPGSPGLYRNGEKIGDQNLSLSLSYIFGNAVNGDEFDIILGIDESVSPMTFDFSSKIVNITLLGYINERTITFGSNGNMFTIGAGVIFTLDRNIKLVGRSTNNGSIIRVNAGTFIMNGSIISGNDSGNGGGVYVTNGAFTMNTGTISGNSASGVFIGSGGTFIMNLGYINSNTSGRGGGVYITGGGTFTMNGGIIFGNKATYGGGVCVGNGDGTFMMRGGSIIGNTSTYGGGIYIDSSGIFIKQRDLSINSGIIYGSEALGSYGNQSIQVPLRNSALTGANGHAIYVSSTRIRTTTVEQTDQINSSTGKGLSANGFAPFGN